MVNWEKFWKYDKYAFSKNCYKRQRKVIIEIGKLIKIHDYKTVLDIGCGEATAIKTLANKYPDIKFSGYDTSMYIVKQNKKQVNKKNLIFKVVDMKKLGKKDKFDVIICLGVLAHFLDPLKEIKYLMTFLNKNGSLIINYPNINQLKKRKGLDKKLPEDERKYWEKRLKLMYQKKNLITFNWIKKIGYPCKIISKDPKLVQIINS